MTITDTQNAARSAPLRILIVDDESGIREGLKVSLEARGFEVSTAPTGEEGVHLLRQAETPFHALVTDFKMSGLNGFDVIRESKKQYAKTRVILMTAYGSIPHAVEAMRLGADDYLQKPFQVEDLENLLQKIDLASIAGTTTLEMDRIISEDSSFKILLQKAERAARSNAPILIEGPSGTGKELLARQIHEWSPRKNKAWVAINCAALPQGLLESELFGYEKGAFTGATERKPGKFEQATGGTLLLDEIGELDHGLQAKLLRVLQEGEVDRLGGRKSLKVDVRIIATTNKNLEGLVRKGLFREDLFFRLYGVRLTLPALKNRPKDIEVLAHAFLKRQSESLGQDLTYADDVVRVLVQKDWPGNIRELERAVERAAVMTENGVVGIHHFEFSEPLLNEIVPTAESSEQAADLASAIQPRRSIREMEQDIILRALDAHGGNRTHTAKSLGMSLRTLRHKLKQYRDSGIEVDKPQARTDRYHATRQKILGNAGADQSSDATLAGFSGASIDGPKIAIGDGGSVLSIPAPTFQG